MRREGESVSVYLEKGIEDSTDRLGYDSALKMMKKRERDDPGNYEVFVNLYHFGQSSRYLRVKVVRPNTEHSVYFSSLSI
jgi:hypothetical protein